jgi:ferrochelatase
MSPPRGALLINLGTPDAPRPREVRRYLREFLSDPRVIDIPTLPRKLLLETVILPTRPRRTAAAYAKVWSDSGSPLLVHSEALRAALERRLGEGWVVALGMRYGRPSLDTALRRLEERGVREVIALPLFPQYSSAATGSALAALFAAPAAARLHRIHALGPFHDDAGFVARGATSPRRARGFRADHVLFSYHGLPERQIRAADPSGATASRAPTAARAARRHASCYRAQCYATTAALVDALGSIRARTSTSFQSRLGRTPWIRPFTDLVLPELAAAGVRRARDRCVRRSRPTASRRSRRSASARASSGAARRRGAPARSTARTRTRPGSRRSRGSCVQANGTAASARDAAASPTRARPTR